MAGRAGCDFSFSGLKTAVRHTVETFGPLDEGATNDLAASFQAAAVDVLADRTRHAAVEFRRRHEEGATLVAAGGVAANAAIRAALRTVASDAGLRLSVPPVQLCTDNAAMVAWAGVERGQLGMFDGLGVAPRARWPLQEVPQGGSLTAEPSRNR
jgi:N6-L-threonylcarbamoyladenine synthase